MATPTRGVRASVAATCMALAAAATALDPQLFVAGWPIDVPADTRVFDVPLTSDVYAAAAGLEQVAVLDADGNPQPFFRRPPAPSEPSEQRITLEASPLYAGGSAAAPNVGVTTTGRGTSVTVTTGSSGAAAITGFVVDARAVETAPAALELEWRALPQPFLLDVEVEQSTDLTVWHSVGRASIASLAIGGGEVRHARVPVRAAPGGYLRITPSRAVADWHLLSAALVHRTHETVAPLRVLVTPLASGARPRDASADALYFDAGGILPVQSAALSFAGEYGWARADVAASRSLDGPWVPVAYGALFYSLSFEGRAFNSEPVTVGRQEARFWRVTPSAPLRSEQAELALEFPQEYVRVAATGRAPYLLAAGTLVEEAGPDATLASVWPELEPPADVVPFATLGSRRELGGAAALVAPRTFPWRSAALWGVLIVGVLVVATMAVRLAREMRSQPS